MERDNKCDYDSLNKVQSTKWGINYMVANSLTTAFLFGFSLTSINPVKNLIAIQFGWCSSDSSAENQGSTVACSSALSYGSAITVGVLVGGVLGSIIGGKLVQFGRRTAIILSHSIYFIGNIISALSEGVLTLTTARIILGIAIGICAYATPCYISEITPKQKRGLYGVLFQLFITVGILVANVLGLAVGSTPQTFEELSNNAISPFQKIWWRLLLGVPALLSAVSIFLSLNLFTLETPHVMLIRGEYEECAALLRVIYNKDDVKEEYNSILNAITEAKTVQSVSLSIQKALLSSIYRPVILIGFILSSFQQFTGINLLITNSNRLFSSIGLSPSVQLYLSVGLTFVNVLMTFPPIFIIDKLGRRTLLLISIAGMTIGLLPGFISNIIDPFGDVTAIISAVSTFIFIISFAIGYGPIPYVFLHEIFPIEIKESASSFAMALNWLASIIIVAPSDFLLKDSSLVIFCVLFATNIIALLFILFFIKETKGISIDESPYFKGKNLTNYPSLKAIKDDFTQKQKSKSLIKESGM